MLVPQSISGLFFSETHAKPWLSTWAASCAEHDIMMKSMSSPTKNRTTKEVLILKFIISHVRFVWCHFGKINEKDSLQNRRDFLRISGEQGRWRGKREASAKCELRARGGSLKKSRTSSRTQLALRARLAFAPVPLKYAKSHALSAG